MKKILFTFILYLSLPALSFTQETINIGFVDGIWFSEKQFYAGDDIYINAAFYNDSGHDIVGTVDFYDNDTVFHTAKIEVLQQKLYQVQAPYTAQAGEHVFKVEITKTKKIKNGEEIESINPINTVVIYDTKLDIDTDTDGDGIGNKIDEDDDGDGYKDTFEIENNSDPLSKISTPETAEILEKVETATTAAKNTSKTIFEKVESVRNSIEETIADKIEQIEKTYPQAEPFTENAPETTPAPKQVTKNTSNEPTNQAPTTQEVKKNIPTIQESDLIIPQPIEKSTSATLTVLKILHVIFSSLILSVLLLLLLLYISYKLLRWFLSRKNEQ